MFPHSTSILTPYSPVRNVSNISGCSLWSPHICLHPFKQLFIGIFRAWMQISLYEAYQYYDRMASAFSLSSRTNMTRFVSRGQVSCWAFKLRVRTQTFLDWNNTIKVSKWPCRCKDVDWTYCSEPSSQLLPSPLFGFCRLL